MWDTLILACTLDKTILFNLSPIKFNNLSTKIINESYNVERYLGEQLDESTADCMLSAYGSRMGSMCVFVFSQSNTIVFGVHEQKACTSMGTANNFEIGNKGLINNQKQSNFTFSYRLF